MRELGDEGRVRVHPRVAVVDAVHGVLRHQDRLGADLERPQRRGGVGREERVARPSGEDHDPALLQVAHGAPADVRLRNLGHRQGREHAGLRAAPLERVLDGHRVEHAREHPRVVGRRPVHPGRRPFHAADDVAAADDDRDLRAVLVDGHDLAGERLDALLVDAELAVAAQGFPGELEHDAGKRGRYDRLGVGAHGPTLPLRSARTR